MLPKVSIVTVNYNMRDGLAETAKSVTAQTYPNLEYVIIDGGSTDGSVEVIRRFSDHVNYWVSERDRSLYHAMNKGAAAATGEWVLFMNSGDRFADEKVVADVFATPHEDADLVYGGNLRHYALSGIQRVIPPEAADILPLRMNCSHQALFTRRSVLLAHPFRENMISSDYEFLLSSWVEGRRFKPVSRLVASVDADGLSNRKRLLSLRERRMILREHGLMTPRLTLRYAWLTWRAIVGLVAKRVLPAPVVTLVLRHKKVVQGS